MRSIWQLPAWLPGQVCLWALDSLELKECRRWSSIWTSDNWSSSWGTCWRYFSCLTVTSLLMQHDAQGAPLCCQDLLHPVMIILQKLFVVVSTLSHQWLDSCKIAVSWSCALFPDQVSVCGPCFKVLLPNCVSSFSFQTFLNFIIILFYIILMFSSWKEESHRGSTGDP